TGDKIIKVNDAVIADKSLDEIVNLIRGPRGTEVKLTISRDDWTETKDIKIIRGIIKIPSLKWELKNGNIAYIKLYQFSKSADFDFRKIALEILDSPAEKIILDLRNNPGGYLEVSQSIAGWFLKKGDIVVSEDFGDERKKNEYRANGPEKLFSYPIALLVNKGSASASEILAAAIRDNRGAKLIGEKTYGKGSVQVLERLKNGASIKITVAKWLTPKNKLINGVGLEPDIEVEIRKEDYKEEKDPQLDKAIEIIQKIK
ncbi:MAG: S41 family peptidase, partial [Patescibacteria group bacterium]|nr:S41 family peptidase [Patescibacteria group bacterium]